MNCENTNKGNTTVQQQSSEDSRIPCTPESVKIWNTKQKNSKLAQDDREKKMKIQMKHENSSLLKNFVSTS